MPPGTTLSRSSHPCQIPWSAAMIFPKATLTSVSGSDPLITSVVDEMHKGKGSASSLAHQIRVMS